MDSLPNTSPSPEPTIKSQATPLLPQAKSPEVVSESGDRRLSRLGPRQPEPEQLPCPRCDSTNTKFCYYNNYNLSQPRHFCKSCRRYWTRGGALRNVPVGGGTRKASSSNKRHRIATTITPATATATASNSNNLVSCSSDNDVMGQSKAVEPVVSNPVPGLGFESIQVAAVNLNEAAVAKSGSSSCWWTSAQTGSGGGLLPFINGYGIGLGPVVGYEQGVLDWPMKQVSGGDSSGVVVSGESPGWQLMGGDADQGGVAEADYFSWPHLTISTTAKALK